MGYISPYSLILRYPVEELKKNMCVPTTIDAFDQVIFHPTRDDDKPKRGLTINIGSSPLKIGVYEYVASDLKVEYIDLIPVYIDDFDRKRRLVSIDKRFLNLLEIYYKNL